MADIPALTNHIPNPSFEVDLAGWSLGSVSLVRDTALHYAGVASLKATVTSVAATAYVHTHPTAVKVSPGEIWSFSYRYYTSRLGSRTAVQLQFYDAAVVALGGAIIGPTATADAANAWRYGSYNGVVVPAGAASVRVLIRIETVGGSNPYLVGDTVNFDCFMAAPVPTLIEYVDGSLSWLHSWEGTAHASRSTRAAITQDASSDTYLGALENWWPNPSWETNATGYSLNGFAFTTSTEWKWVGNQSGKYTLNAEGAARYVSTLYISTEPTYYVPVVPGVPFSFSIWAMTPVADRRLRLTTLWYDSDNVLVGSFSAPVVNMTPDVPAKLSLAGQVAPNFAARVRILVYMEKTDGTTPLLGDVLYLDGLSASPSADIQTYVDGSLGAYHGWLGTAHASRSYRERIPLRQGAGRPGVTRVSPELWLATQDNQMIEDITGKALTGKASTNIHNQIKGALTLSMHGADAIRPYADIVAPFLALTHGSGETERHQLGLYIVTPPKRTHREQVTIASLEGRDLTWILDNDYPLEPYSIAVGTNYVAEAASIISSYGLRIAIPSSTLTAPAAVTWMADKSWLTIVNDLLNAAGYYTLWADRFGVLKSQPYFELASKEPAMQLYSGEGGIVSGAIEQEGVYDTVANRVIVFKDDPTGTPIREEAINQNPVSPSSTVALGRTITRIIKPTELASSAVAEAMALQALEEGSSFTNKLKITTYPRPERDLHETFDLAIYNAEGLPIGFGLWWCDGYEQSFAPNLASTVFSLKRLELYTG